MGIIRHGEVYYEFQECYEVSIKLVALFYVFLEYLK